MGRERHTWFLWGNRTLVISYHRWEDNIKMDLKEMS
jgi:hypothetical protein